MNHFQEALKLTEHILGALQQINYTSTNRVDLIEQVNQLIEQREIYIQQMEKPYSADEMKIGKQIVQMNEEIKGKMDMLYGAVKADMKQLQKRKEQNYSYLKPYGNLKTTDGMYLDNKL